jgi:antitoxin HicB
MMSQLYDFTVVLDPQPDGGFTVRVPALPEVITEGDTETEALAMAEEAIRLVLAYRLEHGIGISPDAPPTLRKVIVVA